ncbi:MAG: 50S ribosomal protein L10 [Rhodospirillaceae bacterium]|nr:50S ribosomal protein L10 [Rhodospirillaceae bacterium]
MERAQKEEKVAQLHEGLLSAETVIITHAQGMTVAESTDLRRKVREAGASFRVTKNRLARRALKGTAFEHLEGLFTGPTAVAYGTDPIAVAKVVWDYAKKSNNKLTVVGGGLGGQTLTGEAVEALTKMPPIEELRAKIVGLLQAPAGRLVGVLPAPAGQLARVIAAPPAQVVNVLKAYSQTGAAA